MDIIRLPIRFRPGDHICQFYDTAADLAEVLVPYFRDGLERNEACIWITAAPLGAERAASEMRSAVADFDARAARGQILIMGHQELYTQPGAFDQEKVIQGWLHRMREATGSGYAGLRVNGNGSFIEPAAWETFVAYERAADVAFRHEPITVLCSYCAAQCSGPAVLDVMANHQCGIVKRRGGWITVGGAQVAALPHGLGVRWVIEHEVGRHSKARSNQFTLVGEDVAISLSEAHRLSTIVKELLDNSSRFGALARPGARVAAQWSLEANGSRRLQVTWSESGAEDPITPEEGGMKRIVLSAAAGGYMRTFEHGTMTFTFALPLDRA
jgi:hypothetical protein